MKSFKLGYFKSKYEKNHQIKYKKIKSIFEVLCGEFLMGKPFDI